MSQHSNVDHEDMCWTASAGATGTEAALWAIAASLYKLAVATELGAQNFSPKAEVGAPIRALETLAVAVDNIADALDERKDLSDRPDEAKRECP